MRQAIDPIRRTPPPAGSLLQSVSAVPGDWRSGVSFRSRQWESFGWPDCIAEWEACAEATLPDKAIGAQFTDDSEAVDVPTTRPGCATLSFDPFTIYTPISEISVTPDEVQRATRDAMDAHESMFSHHVAVVLAGASGLIYGAEGVPVLCQVDGENHNLVTAAGAVLFADPLPPITAFGMLLHDYGCKNRSLGGAMMHVPLAVLPSLISTGLVAQVGQRFVGPGGVIVVADSGYCSMEVDNEGQVSYMYVSGPVEVSTAPAVVIPGSEVEDSRLNQWSMLIEQRAIYRFDEWLVARTQVCLPGACDTVGPG